MRQRKERRPACRNDGGMSEKPEANKPVVSSSEAASARDEQASNLMAMLIAGLALVVIGGIAVMAFV